MQHPNPIIIVSGLPRSGTSAMMQMLAAGGIPIVTDAQRQADDDNPHGYYELERVKALRTGDTAWVTEARGQAVKVITALLSALPATEQYKVILMRRDLAEVMASQRTMLARRGEPLPSEAEEQELLTIFTAHLAQVTTWLALQSHIEWIEVSYSKLIAETGTVAEQVAAFTGGNLDVRAMSAAVDAGLYRNKKPAEG